jgi:hypothetical protein
MFDQLTCLPQIDADVLIDWALQVDPMELVRWARSRHHSGNYRGSVPDDAAAAPTCPVGDRLTGKITTMAAVVHGL